MKVTYLSGLTHIHSGYNWLPTQCPFVRFSLFLLHKPWASGNPPASDQGWFRNEHYPFQSQKVWQEFCRWIEKKIFSLLTKERGREGGRGERREQRGRQTESFFFSGHYWVWIGCLQPKDEADTQDNLGRTWVFAKNIELLNQSIWKPAMFLNIFYYMSL